MSAAENTDSLTRAELLAEVAALRDPDNPAVRALDEIARLCGCPEWEYPAQVVRDVEALCAKLEAAEQRLDPMRGMRIVEVPARITGSWDADGAPVEPPPPPPEEPPECPNCGALASVVFGGGWAWFCGCPRGEGDRRGGR